MRVFFPLFFLLIIPLFGTANAGFGEDYKPVITADSLPPLPVRKQTCVGTGGISGASVVARDTALLAKKFETIPVGPAKQCSLDDEEIAIQRYAEYGEHVVLVTTLNGNSRLVYDPVKGLNSLVLPDLATWPIDNCPGSTIEWLQQEMLRRIYACYPEAGYHVSSLAADKAAMEAREAAAVEAAKGPKKNPGL